MATTAVRAESALANPLSRQAIENAIETLVALLDTADPDPDVELNGDELDGNNSEDDFIDHEGHGLPGCPVSDPGEYAAPETAAKGQREFKRSLPHEDAEDDEGGGDTSGDEGEPDFGKPPKGYGAGCQISDAGGCEHDGREPDHDAEIETWSHWMDHDPAAHIGKRPGWTA